jgi:hypothetical protein
MAINAEWHRAHRMPKNPTLAQRLAWHRDHEKNCACRPMPPALRARLESQREAKPLPRRARIDAPTSPRGR